MTARREPDRSVVDVIAATLVGRCGVDPADARVVAAHVICDLFHADWQVLTDEGVDLIAAYRKATA